MVGISNLAIRAFHHVGITVTSLERSIKFYCELFGFEEVFRWNPRAPYIGTLVGYPDVDLHAAVLRHSQSNFTLELLEYRNVESAAIDSRNGNPGTSHLAFHVEHLDEAFAHLDALGVAWVSRPVTPTMGPNKGGRAVYLIDPDGIRVELIETSGSFHEYAQTQQASPSRPPISE